jgi:tetratricopeptide (TPR) repeat protein
MRKLSILAVLLLAASASAFARDSADHWLEVTTPHFVILTDASEKQGRHVASQFERMRTVFQALMPAASDSAGSPIVVLALKDKKAFQSLEPEAYLAKGQLDLAGLFMQAPDKNYILLRLDAEGEHPFSTVYHEYTHFMMRKASEWLPLWLNEGLAEFFQNTDIHDKDVLLGQPSPGDILYLRQNKLLPIPILLKVDQTSPYYHEEQKGSVFYAESWALTHMIEVEDRQKGTNRIQAYSKLLAQKVDPATAAQQAFGDLNQLQRALNTYISENQFMMFRMNSAITVDESAFQVHALSTADADATRADVLVYNQRTKDAQSLIDSTLRDDPRNALAHETMGYLKFREGDIAGAQKWYSEAVQLDSKSYLAHYYFATMSMDSLSGGQRPEIESSLQTCIKLNPSFAPAYDALARYYAVFADKPDEAHLFNVKAIGLEPGNLNYRLNASTVLMNQQKYDDALRILKAAIHVARTPQEVASVQARIDQINQVQTGIAKHKESAVEAVNLPQVTTTSTVDTRAYTVTGKDGRKLVLKPVSAGDESRYPSAPATGPHHTARGVLRTVQCFSPAILTVELAPAGKAALVALYSNNYYQIEFTALNFTPAGEMNPCLDIDGLKAKVEYADTSDKANPGQILSIELSK